MEESVSTTRRPSEQHRSQQGEVSAEWHSSPSGTPAVSNPENDTRSKSRRRRKPKFSVESLLNKKPEIAGYLTKRGKINSRSWKTRWFEAFPGDDGVIIYYKNEGKRKQLGCIYLQNAEVESLRQEVGYGKEIFGFNIRTRKRVWEIITKDSAVAASWLEILQRQCISTANAKIIEAEEMMSPSSVEPFEPWGIHGLDFRSDFDNILGGSEPEKRATESAGAVDDDNRTSGLFSMDFNVNEGDSSTDEEDSESNSEAED